MKNNPCLRANLRTYGLIGMAGAQIFLLAACDTIGAKPWDRDLMAKRSMQLDTEPLITACETHIRFSKEGSSGGRGFSGGGCGCN